MFAILLTKKYHAEVLSFLTNHMAEVSQNTPLNTSGGKLSIMDKYFSFKKEWRINRMQFFVRNLVMLSIWLLLIESLWFAMGWWLSNDQIINQLIENPDQWVLVDNTLKQLEILLNFLMCCIIWVNICKRAHDYNHKWRWHIILPVLIWLLLIILWSIVGVSASISFIFGIISIAMAWLLLQFRKWNPWSNKYGPAPTGKPLV